MSLASSSLQFVRVLKGDESDPLYRLKVEPDVAIKTHPSSIAKVKAPTIICKILPNPTFALNLGE